MMEPSRLKAMRILAYNLRVEGYQSRADWVEELIDALEENAKERELIINNLKEVVSKSEGNYAAYVAQTTLNVMGLG